MAIAYDQGGHKAKERWKTSMFQTKPEAASKRLLL